MNKTNYHILAIVVGILMFIIYVVICATFNIKLGPFGMSIFFITLFSVSSAIYKKGNNIKDEDDEDNEDEETQSKGNTKNPRN